MGMKQILVMMAVVVLVGQSVVADDKLIADPIVEKAIRGELKKPEGELTEADLAKVTRLDFNDTQITDVGLKEVAKLKNLYWLSLGTPKSPTRASRKWPSCSSSMRFTCTAPKSPTQASKMWPSCKS